jgi:hypothetical protein
MTWEVSVTNKQKLTIASLPIALLLASCGRSSWREVRWQKAQPPPPAQTGNPVEPDPTVGDEPPIQNDDDPVQNQ